MKEYDNFYGRDEFKLEFRCAKHPNTKLDLQSPDNKDSSCTGTEVSFALHLIPCYECRREYDLLARSIEVIVKAKEPELPELARGEG